MYLVLSHMTYTCMYAYFLLFEGFWRGMTYIKTRVHKEMARKNWGNIIFILQLKCLRKFLRHQNSFCKPSATFKKVWPPPANLNTKTELGHLWWMLLAQHFFLSLTCKQEPQEMIYMALLVRGQRFERLVCRKRSFCPTGSSKSCSHGHDSLRTGQRQVEMNTTYICSRLGVRPVIVAKMVLLFLCQQNEDHECWLYL